MPSFIHFLPLSSTFIHFYPFYQLSSTFLHFHPCSSTFIQSWPPALFQMISENGFKRLNQIGKTQSGMDWIGIGNL